MSGAKLNRTAFVTGRDLEFFSESELTTQIGYGKRLWPLVLTKELVDNALDGCESGDAAPIITITLEADALTVADNGPGIPPEVIEHSLNYTVRVSDKKNYISPSRGQLGNALKCIWACPFVATGEGLVEVTTRGLHHRVEVSLDRIAGRPRITHTTEPDSVKIGTSVTVHWNSVTSYETGYQAVFYQNMNLATALGSLVADYQAFNPHAAFECNGRPFPASDPAWRKWRTDQPTSAHWYRPIDLRQLVAAYIVDGDRPMRDFLAEFAGLSGTKIRKAVLEEAQLAGKLGDLVVGDDIDMGAIERLLAAMRKHSKPVDPVRLGVIGKDHLEKALSAAGAKGLKYQKITMIDDDGLPCVLEIAFGVLEAGKTRKLAIGLNWSPVFKVPSGAINQALNDCRIQSGDPVFLLIHQARPRFAFVDHGKGALADDE